MEKPTIEIHHFECDDIITTSPEHDNAFGDIGSLAKQVVGDVVDYFKEKF